jgi:hypothetical protein
MSMQLHFGSSRPLPGHSVTAYVLFLHAGLVTHLHLCHWSRDMSASALLVESKKMGLKESQAHEATDDCL